MTKKRNFSWFIQQLFSILSIGLLAWMVVWVFNHPSQMRTLYLQLFNQIPAVEKIVEKVDQAVPQEIKKQVHLPPPLRAAIESPQSFLTVAGVIKYTNLQRQNNGLAALTENSLLDQSAAVKAQDMFDKQYFAHDSPEGVGIDQLVANAGYQYIAIGENLALGNFLDDQALVQAWMDSPGHRENILKAGYQEIGVAVVKGTYQGETTWMAVQHFGRPLSSCPMADNNLKQTIETDKNRLEQWKAELDAKFDAMKTNPPEDDQTFNQQAAEYNQSVVDYNKLLEETKNIINLYNNQVAAFNLCANSP